MPAMEIISKIMAALATFTSVTRLYDLRFRDGAIPVSGLLVEAFLAVEEVHAVDARDVILLSSDGELPLDTLLGQQASLEISLANGTRTTFTGLVSEAAMLGSTGSLVRYRLRLSSFLWPLSQSRNNCVWQDQSVVDIVESVLLRYPEFADWRWTDDVAQFMGSARPRSYCIQYRETDLDFISRLLGAEGLGWCMEEHADSVAGHRMVLFADSTRADAFPEDATSRNSITGQGIRYHNARAGEAQDTIQALAASVSLGAASVTTLSYDYKAKKSVAASVPTNQQVGGAHAPRLESYDTPGLYAYASADEAQRYAQLRMEAMEAANQRWEARSTVRTLRPGTHFSLTQGPLNSQADATPIYNVLRVVSMGINNLPGPAVDGLAELFGPIPEINFYAHIKGRTSEEFKKISANYEANTSEKHYSHRIRFSDDASTALLNSLMANYSELMPPVLFCEVTLKKPAGAAVQHYNWYDKWYFSIQLEKLSSTWWTLSRKNVESGELPNWPWLNKTFPNKYPNSKLVKL